MINIEDINSNLLQTEKESHKNIDIHYNGYIRMKNFDYFKILHVNPLYLITGKVEEYVKEKMEINT